LHTKSLETAPVVMDTIHIFYKNNIEINYTSINDDIKVVIVNKSLGLAQAGRKIGVYAITIIIEYSY
jgi:hypothetical protein